jgi:hypothetical protein
MTGGVTYKRNTAVPRKRAAARNLGTTGKSTEPARRWGHLRLVMRTKRKLKVLVYQLTELNPTRYTRDIRDRFELVNMRKLGTSPAIEFLGH